MIEMDVVLELPEGRFQTTVNQFTEDDRPLLTRIYRSWRSLCNDLSNINARAVNLPEGLSEGAFCLATGAVRITSGISGANTSWDCFNIETQERIQLKACSVMPDLTSFGPASEWDRLYFVDFYRNGDWDGTFDIYLIPNNLVYNHMVNAHQTFRDQQRQGRRPRFSVYRGIIQETGLEPVEPHSLFS